MSISVTFFKLEEVKTIMMKVISIFNNIEDEVIELYDSSRVYNSNRPVSYYVLDYLKSLFPTRYTIRFVKVQQHPNRYDCGCFAIANLIARMHNQPLHSLNIPIMHLRPYIKHVLENKQLITFIQYMNTVVNVNVLPSNIVEIADETVPMEIVEESTLTKEQQGEFITFTILINYVNLKLIPVQIFLFNLC